MIFETEHTARVPYKCCQCTGQIKPGERYVRVRITPNHDDYGNTGWLRYASHPARACDWRYADEPEKPEEPW